jgi:hypothetical protein
MNHSEVMFRGSGADWMVMATSASEGNAGGDQFQDIGPDGPAYR